MSIVPGPLGRHPTRSPRTPGPLGHNDAASPNTAYWFLGDSPGPLGRNDHADPDGARTRTQGKKFATLQEIQDIQALIDQANVAEQAAAEMEREAKALRQAKDAHAAATERAAHAKRREVRGLRQQAITLAVAAYGINIYHVKSLLYDDTEEDNGTTDYEGNVTIGKTAFISPGELGSTIAHEAEVHVMQFRTGRSYDGLEGSSLNEVEAYDWEIVNAPRFGHSKDRVAGLRRNRSHYLPYLSKAQLQRRQRGDYTMEKGHEDD
jgi:hypothetical protein